MGAPPARQDVIFPELQMVSAGQLSHVRKARNKQLNRNQGFSLGAGRDTEQAKYQVIAIVKAHCWDQVGK